MSRKRLTMRCSERRRAVAVAIGAPRDRRRADPEANTMAGQGAWVVEDAVPLEKRDGLSIPIKRSILISCR